MEEDGMTYENLVYVHKTNDVIDGVFCGPFPDAEGFEKVPDHVVPKRGDLRALWDETWNTIPYATLVVNKIVPVPVGFKLVGLTLAEMTLKELIDAGQVKVPSGEIYDASLNSGAGGIRGMTPSEKAYAGLIDQGVLQSQLFAMIDSKMGEILANGFVFESMRFSGTQDQVVNATGVNVALAAGIPVDFPLQWPDASDNTVTFKALADFQGYVKALFAFVQSTSANIGAIKNNIRQATSAAMAAKIYDNWEAAN
jgi:hypothetical protein